MAVFCKYCGKELKPGAVFCGNCGAKLDPPPENGGGMASQEVSGEPGQVMAEGGTTSEGGAVNGTMPGGVAGGQSVQVKAVNNQAVVNAGRAPQMAENKGSNKTVAIIAIAIAVLVTLVVVVGGVLAAWKAGVIGVKTFDISNCYTVEVSGASTQATAAVKVDDEKLATLLVGATNDVKGIKSLVHASLSKESGIANGDEIVLTFDIDNEGIKKVYGIEVTANKKTLTVEGLDETLAAFNSITESDLSSVTEKVRSLVEYDLGNQNVLIPGAGLKDMVYKGCYYAMGEDGKSGNVIPVYYVTASYPYGNGQATDDIVLSRTEDRECSYYTGILIRNVRADGGKVTLAEAEYGDELFNPDKVVQIEGGYRYKDVGDVYFGFIGYETMEAFKNDIAAKMPGCEILESMQEQE